MSFEDGHQEWSAQARKEDPPGGGNGTVSLTPVSHDPRIDEAPHLAGVLVFKWLLLLTDILGIVLAAFLATRATFHLSRGFCLTSLIASLFVYPQAFYILDLYNIQRIFQVGQTAARGALATAGTLIVIALFYYVVGYGWRETMAGFVQAALLWCFVLGIRGVYRLLFQQTAMKTPVLIIGAGCCGRAIYEVLKSPLSPYDIKGFLDDDPNLLGKTVWGRAGERTYELKLRSDSPVQTWQ